MLPQRLISLSALVACLMVLSVAMASGQYMYLDTNGNGASDSGDAVNGIGVPTTVDLYLITNRNRDGTEVTCETGPLSLFAYSVNLLAVDGTVTFSNFTNRQPDGFYSIYPQFNPDGVRYQTFLANSSRELWLPPGGPHLLATLSITARTGTPRVDIVPQVSGSLDGTFFGSECYTASFTNVFYLGIDWFDADGLRYTAGSTNRAPVLSTLADMSLDVGEFALQEVTATDPDHQIVGLSLGSAPRFALLSDVVSEAGAARGALRLGPRSADAGVHSLSVVATDGSLENVQSIQVTVQPGANHLPQWTPVPAMSVVAGRVRSELVYAGDPDGNPLRLSKAAGPAYAAVRQLGSGEGGAIGEIRLAPGACESGSGTLAIVVFDGSADTRMEVPIRVFPPPESPPPPLSTFRVGGRAASDVALSDLNGDGDLDAIVSFEVSDEVAVFLGNGAGQFVQSDRRPARDGPWSLAVADFNGDGKPDAAVTNSWVASITVFMGNGDGTLQPGATIPVGVSPHDLEAADMNSDGRSDLVVTSYGPSAVSVLLGKGDGTFDPGIDDAVGAAPMGCAVSDFNVDGRPDVAVSTLAGRTIDIGIGTGDGALAQGTVIDLNGNGSYSVVSGDWNRDGAPDLAATNYLASTLQIFQGDGSGDFALTQEVAAGFVSPSEVETGDFDLDGWADIALLDIGETGFYVARGMPDGSFASPLRLLAGGPVNFAAGDVNANGILDFVLVGGDQAQVLLDPFTPHDVGARGFLADGHRTTPDSGANSRVCLRLEPLDGSFPISDLDPSTVLLRRLGSGFTAAITPLTDKTTTPSDADRNGITELPLWFERADWRTLFDDVRGRQMVPVGIDGRLVDGRAFCARFELAVVGTGAPSAVEGGTRPLNLAVAPNPLNPAGTIRFTTTRDGFARLSICDVRGRLVRSLLDAPSLPAGEHVKLFDGRNDNGESLASGIYFYHLETREGVLRGRLTILK